MHKEYLEIMRKLYELTNCELFIYGYLEGIKKLELLGVKSGQMFNSFLNSLEKYSVKEQNILDDIKCYSKDLVTWANIHLYNLNNFIEKKPIVIEYSDSTTGNIMMEFKIDNDKINNRLKNVLSRKSSDLALTEHSQFADEATHCVILKSRNLDDVIKKKIKITKLRQIDEYLQKQNNIEDIEILLNNKYNFIYSDKQLTDKLIGTKMDVNTLNVLSDELSAKIVKIPLPKYINHKEDCLLEEIENLKIIYEKENNKLLKDYNISIITGLLKELSTEALSGYLGKLETILIVKADKKDEVIKRIKEILKTRSDYRVGLLEGPAYKETSIELIDKFSSLVKLNELIYDKHHLLCELDKKGMHDSDEYDNIKNKLQFYLELEKQNIEELDISDYDAKQLRKMCENDICFFLRNGTMYLENEKIIYQNQDKVKAEAIKERMYNMLPNINYNINSSAKNDNIWYYIHKNHLIQSLINVNDYMNDETDNDFKEKMLDELYKESYRYPMITGDLLDSKFRPNNMLLLDEDLTTTLLDVNDVVYYDEKDTELYVLGLKLITEMLENKENEIHTIYTMAYLEDIIQNISVENLSSLKEHFVIQCKNCKDKNKVLTLKQFLDGKLPSYL